jgi:hypothetical protein
VIYKNGLPLDTRSFSRIVADDILESGSVADDFSDLPAELLPLVPQIQLRGGNVQVNDPMLDSFYIIPGTRTFMFYTQAETSVAAYGRNIVVAYITSAFQPIIQVGPSYQFAHQFYSGYSTSNDRGATWTSGFVPPLPGSPYTFGDPTVAVDRAGNFYYATIAALGANGVGVRTGIQVNKSIDGGRTWSEGVLVQADNGADKDWIAVGPDPSNPLQDNVYVTWTSFQPAGAELRGARSLDGGATWQSGTVFAPVGDPNPVMPQNSIHYSTPYVDPLTGRVYIAFMHFSYSDQDFIRMLITDDAGDTFHWATFNIPGAVLPTVLPVVSTGAYTDCGRDGGYHLTLNDGISTPGRGAPRFLNATRLITQPMIAARNGIVYLTWSNSDSPHWGDPNSGSNVFFIRSDDGGETWGTPVQVNPSRTDDRHHALPSLAIDKDPNDVHILYFTQHTDSSFDVDLANSHDRGETFPADRTARLTSNPFPLAPTNIPLSPSRSTNWDRVENPCFCLGEYLGVTTANGTVYAAWADERNTVTHPINPSDPLSGQTHAQTDVFFQKVKAQ